MKIQTAAQIAALTEAGRQMLVNLGPALDVEDHGYAAELHRRSVAALEAGDLRTARLWAVSLGPEVIGSALVGKL